MYDLNEWNARVAGMHGPRKAAVVGAAVGLGAGIVGLGVVLLGPVYMVAVMAGLLIGLYILTDLDAALFVVLFVMGLIPFGTLPFKVVLTPSLLDITLGAFLMVYLFQWMTGRRRVFCLTPVHFFLVFFALILIFSFVLGMSHAPLTKNLLKQFVEVLLSIGLAIVLPDVIRDERALRRLILMLILVAGATAMVAVVLYILPDMTAERLLVRLARFGYPDGGVIRYIEENPALAERAIGVWVDPNAFGGVLAVLGAMIAPQIMDARPLGGRRWLLIGLGGVVILALLLTYSRGALLALGIALVFIALMRYRRLLWVMLACGFLLLLLPMTQGYVTHLIEGFLVADRATQMRVGEISDALKLIGRYPLFGVGFLGTPTRDIYLGVANLYLSMAGSIGLVGLSAFLLTIASLFYYGMKVWLRPGRPANFESYWLGAYAGIVAALVTGLFDHYFFKLAFQASGALFWLVFGLAMTVSRLWPEADAAVPE